MLDKAEKKQPQNTPLVEELARKSGDPADPAGSYTGRPLPPLETPEQDADDL